MSRAPLVECFRDPEALTCGLTVDMLAAGIRYAYNILDTIDATLLAEESPRLSRLVELANFSTILGNLFAVGVVGASSGVFQRAGPHKYQDLRAVHPDCNAENIEIKVALERNGPKGHLAKAGHYLTCRYVLADANGCYSIGQRGEVAWIWELRFGHLEECHFNVSNTPGDSGKTAVVNREGMERLIIVYVDRERCPYAVRSQYLRRLDA